MNRGKKFLHLQCFCGNSSVGRASASQAEGRGFESRFPLKKTDDANHPFFFVSGPPLQACLQKEEPGTKKGDASAYLVFLKAPPRRAGREWRSLNPADARNAQPTGRAQSRRVGGNGGASIPLPPPKTAASAATLP